VKRVAALASSLALLAFTVGLLGWMLGRVAEHPGVSREVSELPAWFTGEISPQRSPGRAPAPPPPAAAVGEVPPAAGEAAERPHEAVATAAPSAAGAARPLPATAAPARATAGYVDVAGGEVRIALKEYRLVPDRIRLRAGGRTVTFVLRNEGRYAHNFHIEGPDVDARAAKFGPGSTVRLAVTLKAGEYRISCPLSNHDQRGMHGTLLVSATAGGG